GPRNAGTGYTNTFTEDLGAVAAADPSLATVTDPDNTTLASLTATLTNHPDAAAESLAVSGCNVAITVGTYNSSTGALVLTGPATVSQFESCLRSLTYNNSSQNPNTTDRSVTVVANDGLLNSNTATAT